MTATAELPSGLRMAYYVHGERDASPPVLFLAPLARSAGIWEPVIGDVCTRRWCLGFDYRGTGATDAIGPYSLQQFAADVTELLDTLELTAVDVVAASMGAAVALELAIADVNRVRSMVLATPWGKTDHNLRLCFETLRVIADRGTAEELERAVQWFVFSPEFINRDPHAFDEAVRSIASPAAYPGREAQLGHLAAAIDHDVLDELGAVTARTCVIAGREDRMIPARYAEELAARIPRAELHVLDGSGSSHGLTLERQAEFTARILQFLDDAE